MNIINAKNEEFEEVELLGIIALFTELRIDKSSIPEGMFCYSLRHGDDDSFPSTVENSVVVNYYGAILTTEKLNLGTANSLPVGYDNFGYTGKKFYAKDFLENYKLQGRKACRPEES